MKKSKNFIGISIIFIGVFLVSFGGLIIKSFETQNPWQILFWRQFFFSVTIFIFLLTKYKKNILRALIKSNHVSFIMGLGLFFGFVAFVYSMLNTSVANVNFINTTQVIFLTIFSFIFLKEKINISTIISILLAFTGILIIFINSLYVGDLKGNIIALTMPLCFAGVVIFVKKFPKADLTLSGLIASFLVMSYAIFVSKNIFLSSHDFILAMFAGVLHTGIPFILLIIASKYISSSLIGLIMLMEALMGPTWAYIFINDIPSINVFIGGIFILFGVILKIYLTIYRD
ncbi:MAG: DMT family transporter [Pelagibacterales bacterium]|nr:DMT family transporter [Pelagibacterales bacterium]